MSQMGILRTGNMGLQSTSHLEKMGGGTGSAGDRYLVVLMLLA